MVVKVLSGVVVVVVAVAIVAVRLIACRCCDFNHVSGKVVVLVVGC